MPNCMRFARVSSGGDCYVKSECIRHTVAQPTGGLTAQVCWLDLRFGDYMARNLHISFLSSSFSSLSSTTRSA